MKRQIKTLEKITLTDIALALNKSVSTVSKALSDSHEISQATKELIRNYAEQHNFQHNQQAKSLRTGHSYIIGIIVPAIGNAFFSQILEGIEEELSDSPYGLLVVQSKNDVDAEKKCIDMLFRQGVDGFIISPTGDKSNLSYLQELLDSKFPIVLIDRTNNELNTHKVGINNIASTYQAVDKLVHMGRKKILYMTDQSQGVVKERLMGYMQCLKSHGLFKETDMILTFDLYDKDIDRKLHESMQTVLNRPDCPDAIFTSTDFLTHKTFGILKDMNVSIPKQIAFMGFSNTPFSNCFSPPLSCVFQPAKEMGKIAVKKFEELSVALKKDRKLEFDCVELNAEIIVRNSI